MSSRLIAILRRPDGLFAIVSDRATAFERPLPLEEAASVDSSTSPGRGPFVETMRPVEDLPEGLIPRKRLLLNAWSATRKVETLDSEVLSNLLLVLIETLADPAADASGVPPLTLPEAKAPPRPTAARPRAYRGTKYKPPKTPRPRAVDLRPYLCIAAAEDQLLAQLSPHFQDAVARLERAHPFGEVIRSWGRATLRPFGQCWSPDCRKQILTLPPAFKRHLLWSLRACDRKHLARALSAFWALDLEHNPSLRRCVSVLLSICPTRDMVDWCHVIARMPPARRVQFAELLIESSAYRVKPDDHVIDGLLRADDLSPDTVYRHRMFYALCTVKEECTLDYANDGFDLANEFNMSQRFDRVASLSGVSASVRQYVNRVQDASRLLPITLWDCCAQLEGLADLLSTFEPRQLDLSSAHEIMTTLLNCVYEGLDDGVLRRKWLLLRKRNAWMVEWLGQITPPYRPKAIRHIRELIWIWDDDADGLSARFEPYARLVARLCAAPFAESGFEHYALPDASFAPADRLGAIANSPDASFQKLEAATRRENDALLIGRGLRCLMFKWSDFAISAFHRSPARLVKVAHVLGALDSIERDRLLESFRKNALVVVKHESASAQELANLAGRHAQPGIQDPVSSRLKAHLRGETTLGPKQVDRDLALLRSRWLDLQLDTLRTTAFNWMSRGLPAAERSSRVKHALMLQRTAEEHRRSTRKLLQACLSGNESYAQDHPKNREWLRKHSKLDSSKWLKGIAQRGEVSDHGALDLTIEHDALEVLRLGSYFGTCLGVGGRLTYSAAAIALDINKQVVYARNAAGSVVARQVLAISEDDQLVCFQVYPSRAHKEVRSMFRDFDVRFADYLGIELYDLTKQAEGAGYQIANILSRDFWDDYAWDLQIDDE